MHRFVWDLHYPPPKAFEFSYPISATPGDTALEPKGPWVMPGTYTVRLTLEGVTVTQPLVVKMDPRVKTPREALGRQFALSMRLYDAIARVHDEITRIEGPQAAAGARGTGAEGSPAWSGPAAHLRGLHDQLLRIYGTLQEADVAPTAAVVAAAESLLNQAATMKR
jgi:hypothetical protein